MSRPVPLAEAARRLQEAAREAGLVLDPRTVTFRPGSFPCYEYVLRLQQAHALLNMPAAWVEEEGWRERLREPMTRSRRYLEQFVPVQERVDLAARGVPRFQQVRKP
ncbi:MAG: hypothetical protein C4304_07330 [candidate division GAL15 bacterium]